MSRLWIFIEDRYVRYELNHDFIYESLKVHIADCVFVNDVCLDSGECKTIDRYLVYLDASKLCWKCMEVHDVFSIGRDLSNTYVCSDLRVSSFHARIQNGVIEDISSLNGTYVNQKKISSYVLDVGDEILIGFEWFIYLNSYILVHSVEMDLDDISYAVLHTSDYQKNYQNIISPSIFHYDLDLPLTMARVSKSHILNAIGPSFMILVSGLISLLLSSFIAETSVVFSSFLSSLSMAVVFGGYGLWNRAYQYKQGILENKNLEKKYVKYLERIEQQMVSDKCTYSKQFM